MISEPIVDTFEYLENYINDNVIVKSWIIPKDIKRFLRKSDSFDEDKLFNMFEKQFEDMTIFQMVTKINEDFEHINYWNDEELILFYYRTGNFVLRLPQIMTTIPISRFNQEQLKKCYFNLMLKYYRNYYNKRHIKM